MTLLILAGSKCPMYFHHSLPPACHNFIEVPVNTTCTLEQTVTLRCRPPGNTILVYWTVNGESYRNFLPTDAFSASNFLYTLQFTCTSEWHYRTVQCVARILSGEDEESPPALIKVEGAILQCLLFRGGGTRDNLGGPK